MRIGIDYLPAVAHASGVGRYARELVRALVRLEERPDLALYEVGRAPRLVDEHSLGLPSGDPRVVRRQGSSSRRVLARLPFGLGAADRALGGIDLFHHVLREPPPVARALETIAVSDLPPEGSDEDQRFAEVLARMRAVCVFSAAWLQVLAARYALPRERIHQIPVGCEHWRRDLAALPAREDPPVLLVLGALRPARRHVAILHALELLEERGSPARVHWIGRQGPGFDDVRQAVARSPIRARVRWEESRPEIDMPALVARASVLVHLADDEGTPVTPLEAFAVGLPVVASRLPAFEEALGGQAEFVDNDEIAREPQRLAAAIERAIASSRDEAAAGARMQVASAFSWERCARATLAVWEGLLARHGPRR